MSRYKPFATGRRITKTARQRASVINDHEIGPYMENALIALGQALDMWRYRGGPASEVALTLDVVMALWNEVELRGNE